MPDGTTSPPKIPPFMIRRIVWFVVIIFVLSIAGTIAVLSLRGRLSPSVHVAFIVLPVLATLPVTLGFVRWSRAISRRAALNDGRMCWNCGYVLTGLAAQGQCPECGNNYTHEELRTRWRCGHPSTAGAPNGSSPRAEPRRTHPRFLRRRSIAFAIVMFVLPLASLGALFAGLLGPPQRALLGVLLGQLMVSLAFTFWFISGHRALLRRLTAAGNLVCFGCGYDVSALPSPGRCPECGDAFDRESLRARWLEVNYVPAPSPQKIDAQTPPGR